MLYDHSLILNLCHESRGFTASMIKIFPRDEGNRTVGPKTLSVPGVGSGCGSQLLVIA